MQMKLNISTTTGTYYVHLMGFCVQYVHLNYGVHVHVLSKQERLELNVHAT